MHTAVHNTKTRQNQFVNRIGWDRKPNEQLCFATIEKEILEEKEKRFVLKLSHTLIQFYYFNKSVKENYLIIF